MSTVFIVGVTYDLAITLTFYGYKDIYLILSERNFKPKIWLGQQQQRKVLVIEEIEIIKSNLIELNKDLFDCYTKAREDSNKGYLKRLKNLWDTLYS